MLEKLKFSFITRGINKPYHSLLAPLLSLFLLNVGIGFVITLVPVLLYNQSSPAWVLGLMSGVNYAGLAFGSFQAEKFILRVGHIRAFSAFASIATICTLLHGMVTHIEFWLILRFLSGICLAGLYVVIESWLISSSPLKVRGRILSIYMIALYAAQGLGQFFIKFDNLSSMFLFSLATLFVAFSIFPLSFTKAQIPKIEEPSVLGFKDLLGNSLSGFIGSFCAGLIMGSLYGLYPIFIIHNFSAMNIEYYMAALIFGGMLLQYPVGRLSDIIERRTVLFTICFLSGAICLVLSFISVSPTVGITLSFILGGFTFTIYPICISHACDTAESQDIVSTTQGLLLVYSIGAALGPIAGSCIMYIFAKKGLTLFISLISIFCGLFIYFRRINTDPVEQEEKFLPSAQTSAVLAELDPRGENK